MHNVIELFTPSVKYNFTVHLENDLSKSTFPIKAEIFDFMLLINESKVVIYNENVLKKHLLIDIIDLFLKYEYEILFLVKKENVFLLKCLLYVGFDFSSKYKYKHDDYVLMLFKI